MANNPQPQSWRLNINGYFTGRVDSSKPKISTRLELSNGMITAREVTTRAPKILSESLREAQRLNKRGKY